MNLTAAAALGALILAASGAPAMAGGYWDGGIVHSDQGDEPPAYSDRDCPCYCPSDRQEHGRGHERRWGDSDQRGWSERDYGDDRAGERYDSDERVYDSGWQDQGDYQDQGEDQDQDYGPAGYSDYGYDVGPEGFVDEGAGGEGFAGAFANVGVDVDIRDRERFGDHDHEMMRHDHHVQPYPPRMMHHEDHQYPQHQGYQPHMSQWNQPMQPDHPMQPGMAQRMPAYSHPTVMRRSGGGRRW
jgi:hypothetical protein